MIIGVDAGCLGIEDERLAVGVYQVAKNLFQQLGKIDKKNIYYLYSFYPINEQVMKSFGPRMRNIVVRPTKGWIKLWLPLQLVKDKPDIFLALNHVLPTKIPFISIYKTISLIHDIAFEKFPDMYPQSFKKLSRETKKTVYQSNSIIAVSKTTKKDIISFYKIHSKKVAVAYEGVRPLSKGKKKKAMVPYFLFVGAMKQQKNIPTLIRAFDMFLKKGAQEINLSLVGGDKWMDKEIEKTLQQISAETKKHIQFLGVVSDQKLANLYTNALAFVSPSYYEGFGLPFIEAMQQGCSVIGSTAGALPEIVGDAGILIDPHNEKKLYKAMENVFNNRKLRENLQQKGVQKAKTYSWELFATQIFSIIAQYEK